MRRICVIRCSIAVRSRGVLPSMTVSRVRFAAALTLKPSGMSCRLDEDKSCSSMPSSPTRTLLLKGFSMVVKKLRGKARAKVGDNGIAGKARRAVTRLTRSTVAHLMPDMSSAVRSSFS